MNITVPDELLVRARLADLNVSRVASAAEELDRLAEVAALDEYLASLNRELGPPSEEEVAAARVWVDELLQTKARPPSGQPWSRVTVLVLDSGGVSSLAAQRARLAELRRRGLWPAQVPSVVLAEALTGDHRRDALRIDC